MKETTPIKIPKEKHYIDYINNDIESKEIILVEGDRLYMVGSIVLSIRSLKAYLKNNFTDVKIVTDIDLATKVIFGKYKGCTYYNLYANFYIQRYSETEKYVPGD